MSILGDVVAVVVVALPPLSLSFAWSRWYRSLLRENNSDWRTASYVAALSAASLTCTIYLAVLYCQLARVSSQPRELEISAQIGVVLCLSAMLTLLVAKGPYRFLVGTGILCMLWALIRFAGHTSVYWFVIGMPFVLTLSVWAAVLFHWSDVSRRSVAALAMVSVTISVLLLVGLFTYAHVVEPGGGTWFARLAVLSFLLSVLGTIAGASSLCKRRDWLGIAATFLSVWVGSSWILMWASV